MTATLSQPVGRFGAMPDLSGEVAFGACRPRCGVKPYELPILRRGYPPVASTDVVDAMLRAGSPVAIGVSGGKDSTAAAFATLAYLEAFGHHGPRMLIHSDLGVTEWPESIEWCRKLAERVGLEVVVVRRAKGDMMDRWEQRWSDNVARYANLSCVQLILPWSTPGMRFCTSELKVAPICAELVRRFPGQRILSVTGIRRQESAGRANAPIAKPNPKLTSVTRDTIGLDWHPIADWTLDDVLSLHGTTGFPLHPAYTRWGVGRVSCMNCILQNDADADAVAKYPGSHALHRRIAALEIASTFAFQGDRWRADVAPGLLDDAMREGLRVAKGRAVSRRAAESRIPKHLLYEKGWPKCVPTMDEAMLLASVRCTVACTLGLAIKYDDACSIIRRYEELMAAKRRKGIA
jgi:3'-phosphoadenosine 5'-phosphosulfate sulfotransferase (PAPS reductase)/FAD synthetase